MRISQTNFIKLGSRLNLLGSPFKPVPNPEKYGEKHLVISPEVKQESLADLMKDIWPEVIDRHRDYGTFRVMVGGTHKDPELSVIFPSTSAPEYGYFMQPYATRPSS